MASFTSYFDNLFLTNDWNKEIAMDRVSFSKHGFETEYYQVIMDSSSSKKYRVSIPIANSAYQYVTYFSSLIQAFNYMNTHI